MKTFVRFGALVIALGLAGLFAGCSSYPSYAHRGQPARDFEIVETSTKRQLTGAEMAYLRAKVRDYLVQQGQTGSGDYYVKVYLSAESEVAEREWVIVRFTNYPSAVYTYSLASTTPTYSYPAYGYSAYDYYPFGFFGLSAFSFRNYDYGYPYLYGSSGYYPRYYSPYWTGSWWHGRDRWRDHRPDNPKDRDHDRPRVGDRRPSGALKPSFVPANVGRTPWDGSTGSSVSDHRRRDNRWENRPDRPVDATGTGRWNDRRDRGSSHQRPAYTPPSSQSGNVGGTPAYRPATRSNLHRDRGDAGYSRPSGGDAGTPRMQQRAAERSYSPPARSESSSSPRFESPRQEASGSTSGRSESSGYTKDRTDGGRGGRRAGLEP